MSSLTVKRLPGPFGAEVSNVDVARDCDASTIHRLVDLLAEQHILIIHDQKLSKAEYAAFGRHFGTPLPFFIESHRDKEYPDLIRISNAANTPATQRDGAAHWHTDSSYETVPASVTMLYALEAPDEGGATLFTDMAAAYDALPEETRRRIDGMRVKHMVVGGKAIGDEKVGASHNTEEVRRKREKEMPVHPLVLPHPITGRKALYAISGSAYGIEGMPDEEGLALLTELKLHALQERFRQSYKAVANDILIWDDLATLHSATPLEYSDEPGKRRMLYRISTTGLPPVYADRAAPFPKAA